jgi:hypothetical protein
MGKQFGLWDRGPGSTGVGVLAFDQLGPASRPGMPPAALPAVDHAAPDWHFFEFELVHLDAGRNVPARLWAKDRDDAHSRPFQVPEGSGPSCRKFMSVVLLSSLGFARYSQRTGLWHSGTGHRPCCRRRSEDAPEANPDELDLGSTNATAKVAEFRFRKAERDQAGVSGVGQHRSLSPSQW